MGMRNVCTDRDQEIERVRLVRRGRIDELYPDLFADDLPRSVVANITDTAARDIAELMSPLPSLACASRNMQTASDERRASNKNKIGSSYIVGSKLRTRQIDFADSWGSYGFGVYMIEPDFVAKAPRIRVESPFGCYYYKNRNEEVQYFAKVRRATLGTIISEYPDARGYLLGRDRFGQQRSMNSELEIVRYYDRDMAVVYLPECNNYVLAWAPNVLSRVPVAIAERPKGGEEATRSAFGDVLWIQLARSRAAQYRLQITDQVANAPYAVPDDLQSMPVGPNAVWRSQNPQQIGKVQVHIPQDLFTQDQELLQEAQQGARYPASRTGTPNASIITGQGVNALQGTLETQVSTAQQTFADALELALSICFEMDAKLWPNERKEICGWFSGKPYELRYTPSKDIGDEWGARVTYGFGAGQNPSQAIVAMLQLRADDIISRDTFRRQLGSAGIDLDPDEEQRDVDVQQLEDAAKQGVSALAQALGPIVQQGGDPLQMLQVIANTVDARRSGQPVDQAIIAAFTKLQEQQKQQQAEQAAQQPGQPPQPGQPGQPAPGGGGGESPFQDNGLPWGVAQGQAGMPPGGAPDLLSLMAQLRNGKVNNVATVSTRRARSV